MGNVLNRVLWSSKSFRIRFYFLREIVLGFIICEIFTVIALQDWVGWRIFTVSPGHPLRANGDSQHLETHPELQDWLRFELLIYRKKLQDRGNNEVIISNSTVT